MFAFGGNTDYHDPVVQYEDIVLFLFLLKAETEKICNKMIREKYHGSRSMLYQLANDERRSNAFHLTITHDHTSSQLYILQATCYRIVVCSTIY